MIADARAKGATAMVRSLIPRNNWRDGKAVRNGTQQRRRLGGGRRQFCERAVH